MQDIEDDNLAGEDGVGHDVGRSGYHQFPRSRYPARTPNFGGVGKPGDRSKDRLQDATRGAWVRCSDISAGGINVLERSLAPGNYHAGLGFWLRPWNLALRVP